MKLIFAHCAVQFLFLGRLSVTETSKLTERLMMFVLLKIVFFGEPGGWPCLTCLTCWG